MTTSAIRHAAVSLILVLLGLTAVPMAQEHPPNPRVIIETTRGDIMVELLRRDAPVSVANFLTYMQDGFYESTIFHRVIRGFMIQGGGMLEDLSTKTKGLRGGILNEATNKLKNLRGTVAMARYANPNSARSQFFINVANNSSLDHKNRTNAGFGYAVFGQVTNGMDVIEEIEGTRTHRVDRLNDVPVEPIIIKQIRRLN